MFYFLAPAGIPISLEDISKAVRLKKSGMSYSAIFLEHIAEIVDSDYAFDFNSGRTALAVILDALSELADDGRNEIVIPAYTCYSVASAVIRCGLKIRLCDVDPTTLDYDYEKLYETDTSHVLAVVACSLFGVSCDWESLGQLQRENGYFLIDDAAQSFGVESDKCAPGTRGDVGFYSFGRGKNLTTYSGGAAVTDNDDIARKIEEKSAGLSHTSRVSDGIALGKMLAYGLLLRPELYWIPNSIPFLGIGETIFDPDFPMARMREMNCRLGSVLLDRIGLLNSIRIGIADTLLNRLRDCPGLEFPGYEGGAVIPYLRLPILMANKSVRDTAISRLRAAGIGASPMYPSTIAEIPAIDAHLGERSGELPGAKEIADRLLTLPTHPYVTGQDIERMIKLVTSVVTKGGE
ncbi:MAG: DegT/DnrJ/EryC1/StrS family aminotransferase [Candidatus Zixiibacteriota bacterium]